MIWSDRAAVVRKFRRLLAGHDLKANGSHFDLWQETQQCLLGRVAATGITKVAAHWNPDQDCSVMHEWCFRHNFLADKHAVGAKFRREGDFWRLHHRHVLACDWVAQIGRKIHGVQLAISKAVVSAEKPAPPAFDPVECELPMPITHWARLPAPIIPVQAVRWYGDSVTLSQIVPFQ